MAFNTNNANNNQAAQNPFWEWVRSLENNNNNHFSGEGVDHPAHGEYPRQDFSFWGPPPPPPPPGPPHHSGEHPPPPPPPPFGGFSGPWGAGFFGGRGGGFGGWGHGGPGGPGGPGMHAHGHGPHGFGRRGRHGRRRDGSRSQEERSVSPAGERTEGEGEEGGEPRERSRRAHCRHGGPRGPHAAHDRRGRGFGRHGFGGRRGPPPFAGPFDMGGLMAALASHPYAQALRGYAVQTGETLVPEDADAENSFTPPIDIFSTEKAYVLHVSLPGAKKEDVGVNFDADRSELNLAGVVYRQGDEEFLKTLTKVERKVGMFERTIKLPPGDNEEKEEVDGDGITAKLEDGVLIVTVPKIEKEWTEVKKVDIV